MGELTFWSIRQSGGCGSFDSRTLEELAAHWQTLDKDERSRLCVALNRSAYKTGCSLGFLIDGGDHLVIIAAGSAGRLIYMLIGILRGWFAKSGVVERTQLLGA